MSSIKVTCINAILTRDTQMFSNMDPYVVIVCGSQKRKTRTHQQGGKRPHWEDSFTFTNPKSQLLKFAVWDEDTVTDDLVGEGTLDISKFLSSPNVAQKDYVALSYKNKPSGKLFVEVTYQSSTGPNNWGSNNNIPAYNTNNNTSPTWGNANNNSNNGWGNFSSPNNGWGNQGMNNNQQIGWNTQNNLGSNKNIQQGWGSNNNINPQNSQGWGNQNNTQGWGQNINQQTPQNNLQKKESNQGVNPYGYTTTDDNTNPYPQLNDNKNNPIENPLNVVIGANLSGQQTPPPPPQQSPQNALNILDMAIHAQLQGQNNSGWGQPPQPPQQGWGQPNQPGYNNWQNGKPNNGWGSGW